MIPRHKIFKEKKKSIMQKGLIGLQSKPRLSVFRSNRFITLQLIDDKTGQTLVYVSEKDLKDAKSKKPIDRASALGELIAQKASKKNIKSAIFDRRGYKYHGRVKNIAEGARKGGLKI